MPYCAAMFLRCCCMHCTAAVEDAFRSLKPGEQLGIGAWSNAIGKAFLAPYNLNSDASTITAAGTAGPIHQAAANLSAQQQLQVYTYRPTTAPAGNSSSNSSSR